MALAAVIIGGHMVSGLTSGSHAIMAGAAVIHDTPVIKRGAGESRSVMTNRAVFCRWQMICRFNGCRRGVTVVA